MKTNGPWRRFEKPFPLVCFALAALPLLCLGIFLLHVLQMRVHLGRWPRYGDLDPNVTGWDFQRIIAGTALLISFHPAVAALLCAIVVRMNSRQFPIVPIVATALISIAVVATFHWKDPGGFIDWFFD